jgi:hypothetical protein
MLTDGEAVEDVDKGFPKLYAVFAFAFIIEAVNSEKTQDFSNYAQILL